MKTVYFPFTVVSESVLADLQACFAGVEMIQPCRLELTESMAAFTEDGFLTVRPVLEEKAHQLLKAHEGFQAFARMHGLQGDLKTRFFSYLEKTETPGDDWIPSQIVSTLKKNKQKESKNPPEAPLLASALFLYLAQRYDMDHMDLEKEMQSLAAAEKQMMESLTGNTPSRSPSAAPVPDMPGSHMAIERLEAWARLFFDAGPPETGSSPGIWVTHSEPAAAHLLESLPHPVQSVHLDLEPAAQDPGHPADAWKNAFREGLQKALEDPDFRLSDPLVDPAIPFHGPRRLSVSVAAVPKRPSSFFKGEKPSVPTPEGAEKFAGRTLVVLLSQ